MYNNGYNIAAIATRKAALMSVAFLVASAVLLSPLSASDRTTYNEVENPFGTVEKGWHFYDDTNQSGQKPQIDVSQSAPKGADNPALVAQLLQQILKENQAQTKIQQEMLRILQDNFDPQPKIVKKADGTECIANSSADCYVVPKTAWAKSVPALSAWMDDPSSVEKAAVYSKWQSTHLNTTVLPMGSSLQFASEQFGVAARPLNYAQPGYDSATGAGKVMENMRAFTTVNKHANQVQLLFFVGKNIDADLYALDNFGQLMNRLGEIKFTLIAYDEATKQVVEDASGWIPSLKRGLQRNKLVVNEKAFNKYGIYTTPSLVAVANNGGKMKAQTVATGRMGPIIYAERVRQYLLLEGIAKYGDDAGYKIWKDVGNVAKSHMRNKYNIDLNTSLISEIKEKQKGIE